MENQDEPSAIGDLRPVLPPENCGRRRFVQSTLFPVTEKEKICKVDECKAGEEDGDEGDEEEEEDWCSNSKRRRNSSKKKANNSNSKSTPRSRASKKVRFLLS